MHGSPGFSQLSNASLFDKSSSAFSQSLVTVSLPARSTVKLALVGASRELLELRVVRPLSDEA